MDSEIFILLWLLLTLSWGCRLFRSVVAFGVVQPGVEHESAVPGPGASLRLCTPMSYQFIRKQDSQENCIILNHMAFLGIPKLWLPQDAPRLQDTHTYFQRSHWLLDIWLSLQTKISREKQHILGIFFWFYFSNSHLKSLVSTEVGVLKKKDFKSHFSKFGFNPDEESPYITFHQI